MQYPKRKKQINATKIIWTIVGVMGAMVLTLLIRYIAFRKPVYQDVVQTALQSKTTLRKEVIALETQIQSYAANQALLLELQDENQQLKAELNRPIHPVGTLATVLFPPGRTLYDTLIIDAGSSDNIHVGQIAYAFGSIALGDVTAVRNHDSTVLLFSSPDRQTSGTVSGSDIAVTLLGRGGGEYEIHMPRDLQFTQNETISMQSTFPAVLAQIDQIKTDPRDPFQTLLAKAPINLENIKWVIVQ